MTLLIVDDEVLAINGILDGVDWQSLPFDKILTAGNVEKAKQSFEKDSIDVLLCDIEMPDGTGLDLLEWVREKDNHCVCLFLTCHEEFGYARRALQLGSIDYLLKPFPYADLQNLLASAAKNHGQQQSRKRYEAYGKEWVEETYANGVKNETSPQQIVTEVKQYIHNHLAENMTVQSIANQVYISADYLHRIFKKAEGTTLVDYITRERLFLASELLRSPDASVSKIATTVGFNSYSYFSKLFKKYYGVNPTKYQKDQHNG